MRPSTMALALALGGALGGPAINTRMDSPVPHWASAVHGHKHHKARKQRAIAKRSKRRK